MISLSQSIEAAIRSKEYDTAMVDSGERGQLILAACQAAAEIERGKRESGLPESAPVPWPASTWRFLKQACKDVANAK